VNRIEQIGFVIAIALVVAAVAGGAAGSIAQMLAG
jgi:hypothetical protein